MSLSSGSPGGQEKEGRDTVPIRLREEASMQVWCSQRRGSGIWDRLGPLDTDSADKGEHEQRRRPGGTGDPQESARILSG